MDTETRHYLRHLLQAWPQAPADRPVSGPDAARDILLAHRVTAAVDSLVPTEWRDAFWRADVERWRTRSGFLLMELERILPTLAADGCKPVVLKGAALACTHYPDPLLRPFLDLDILVPRDKVDAAGERLAACGYAPWSGPRDPLYYDRYHLHRILKGPQGSLLEIHWDLTMPGSVYGFDVAGVFDRAVDIPVGQATMWTAAPVDQVLHSVYQHIADGFVDLKRVLDLKLLLQTLPEGDWLYLVKEAGRTKMGPALAVLLHLVKQMTDLELPPVVADLPQPGPASRRILRNLDLEAGLFLRRAESDPTYIPLVHFLLVPGLFNRLREYARFLVPDEKSLLAQGHWHDRLPGPVARARLALYHLKIFSRLSARALKALIQG